MYETKPFLNNHFIYDKNDCTKMLAMCTNERDAKTIVSALNNQNLASVFVCKECKNLPRITECAYCKICVRNKNLVDYYINENNKKDEI